jgi:PAS domain S-box-containing protein
MRMVSSRIGIASGPPLVADVRRTYKRAMAAETAPGKPASYFRALIENATDLIAVLHADGTIRFISGSVSRILGYRPEELLGTSAFALIHPDDLADVTEAIRAGLEHRDTGLPMTFKARHRDGSWRYLEGTDRNLLDEPAVAGIVINARDVSERVEAETALRDNDRRKDEFLAMLSHELRNPLAAVRSSVDVLCRRGPSDPTIVTWATEMIGRQVLYLARLVDDLLDVSRITRGTITVEKEPLDLGEAISRAVEMVRPAILAGQHELAVLVPPEPVRISGDPVRVPQVIANLLHNAAKYSEPGGHIRITLARCGAEAEIRVTDDGPGIPPDLLPRVFDLFVQADRSHDRTQGGLGVGLTLVRRLVELHGGTVEATSAGPGAGSEFAIRFPVLPEARAPAPVPSPVRSTGRGLRILVVDDNFDAAGALAVILQLMGHEVDVAYTGAAAIDAAVRSVRDLVLLDIGLPGLDGYEVARRLRGRLGHAPMLVALTGYGQAEDRLRSREAGFDVHVVKPIGEDTLVRLVEQCAERSRVAATPL